MAIQIRGQEGVGKSLIAQSAASFMARRHFFSNGIFYLDLRKVPLADSLALHLSRIRYESLEHAQSELLPVTRVVDDGRHRSGMDTISAQDLFCRELRDKTVLIVLDNADAWLVSVLSDCCDIGLTG